MSYASNFKPPSLGGQSKEEKEQLQGVGVKAQDKSYAATFRPPSLGGMPKATETATGAGTANIDAMLKNLGAAPAPKAPSPGNIVTRTPPVPRGSIPAPAKNTGEYTNPVYRALELATKGLQKGMTFGLLPKITDLIPGGDPRAVTPQTGFERGIQTAGGIAGSIVPTRVAIKAVAPAATAGAKKAAGLARAIPTPAKAIGGMAAAGVGAEAMMGATNPEIKERSLPAKAGASFRAGIGDVLDIAGGAARWRGKEALGDSLTARADKIREGFEIAPKGEFTWKSLLDPDFYAVNVTRSAPFTMALIPAMIAGWKTGGALGTWAGLGTFGKTVLSAAGGASLSRPIESALEAGGVFDEAIAKGMTPEQADKAANEVFKKNMKLIGLDAAQLAAAFAPTPAKLAAATTGRGAKVALGAGRIGTGALTEGGEEGYQEAIKRQAMGDDARGVWEQIKTADPQMQEAMAIGGLFGAGMGGAGVMVDAIRQRTVENLPPEQAQEVQAKVAQATLTGADPKQALEQALDEVATTPEGKQAVERAVKEVAAEAQQRLLPPVPMPAPPRGLPPVPPVTPAKVPKTEAATAEVAPGAVVYGKKDGKPYTVVSATDPAMLTVRNENGTELKIGRKAVAPEAPQRVATPAPKVEVAPVREQAPSKEVPKAEASKVEEKPAWQQREEAIAEKVKASKANGAEHLDQAPWGVEYLRGKTVRSLRDGDTAEIITVTNRNDAIVALPNEEVAKRYLGSSLEIVKRNGKEQKRWLATIFEHERGEWVIEKPQKPAEATKAAPKAVVSADTQETGPTKRQLKAEWFELGRKVSLNLPGETTLKPNKEGFRVAADKLGISQLDAEKAWNVFTWSEDAPVPGKPAPKTGVIAPAKIEAPTETAKATETPSPLSSYGLTIERTVTKNNKPVWNVSGETQANKDALQAAGGRWFGPAKAWSFYGETDPTAKILEALGGKQEAAAEAEAKAPPKAEAKAPATKPEPKAPTREELLAEKKQLEEKYNADYWAFTRTAKGKPPDITRLMQVKEALGETVSPWQKPYAVFNQVNPISKEAHKKSVEKALREGNQVPAEVLKDYPELTKAETPAKQEAKPESKPESAPKAETKLPIAISLNDVPYDLAYNAHRATSFVPEDRAKQVQQDYVNHMEAVYKELAPLAKTAEQKQLLADELQRYKQGYLTRYKAMLDAASRTMSAMITGPAKFPKARNEKALAVESKRWEALLEYSKKAQASMKKKIAPEQAKVVSSDDPNAIETLQKKLESREKLQDTMRRGNVVVRNKKLTDEQKVAKLMELGLTEANAKKALEPDFMGRLGFPDYALQNNNAEIRRLKQRIEELTAKRAQDSQEWTFDGGKVMDNVDDNRVQIFFDDKPDEAMRKQLKSRGFRWAPSVEAWQRQRSSMALQLARELTGAKGDPKAEAGQGEAINEADWERGYQDTVAKIAPRLADVENSSYVAGMRWAEKRSKLIDQDIDTLTKPLYRTFDARDPETGERASDPVKFVHDAIFKHLEKGGELPRGVHLIRGKTEGVSIANKTGHAVVELDIRDDKGIPLVDHLKDKHKKNLVYAIEVPWNITEKWHIRGKRQEAEIPTTSMKYHLLEITGKQSPERVYVPRSDKWAGDVVDIPNRPTTFKGWQAQETEVVQGESTLDNIERKLAADVDESVGTVTPKAGLSVQVKGRKKGQQSSKHEFSDPDIEARWQAAKGVPRESLILRARQMISDFKRLATREFEHLPRTGEFSRLRFDLSRLQKYMGVAGDRTLRMLQGITLDMSKEQYDLFTRKVILDDLVQVAAEGKKIPFGFTEEVLEKEAARVNEAVKNDPDVEKAVRLRKEVWDAVKTDYMAAMKDIGADVSGRLSREDYYRHQVLEYTKVKRAVAGTGKKLKTPLGRGFLKKREGSELDINTEYVQAEYEVMAQMLFDIEVAKAIKNVDKYYNIAAEVKQEHGKDWRENVPEGYVTWQPREGTVFYIAASVPEAVAEQLYSGAMQEMGIKEGDLRQVFAKGQRYKEMVIKEEIAATLDNMLKVPSSNPVSQFTRNLQRVWKVWTLISPRRWFKYNFRNITGDADAAFAGNPASFKKVPQATKELYRVYAGDGAMTPDMRDWFDRGGMQTLLQAQELGDINKLKMFVDLTESKGKVTEIPLKAWQGYWKAARMSTDFREAILRYATYLSYLEQMKASPDGRPKNFGASIREEVMALDDIKDRAFKLSNEVLGAYDQVGVIGQALRDHIVPFWSWNEVNFRRYKQLIINAANDGKLAHTVGRSLLKGIVVKSPFIAYRVGKLALKASALWLLLSLWNTTRFPELEERLPESERRKPHIIFGEDEDGNILYFNRLGAMQDFVAWIGVDAGNINDVQDILNGKKSVKEVATEMAAMEPINKLAQSVTPFVKVPAELAFGQKAFPDVFKTSPIRDRGLHVAQSLGLENEYKAAMGLPAKPYENSLRNLFVYTVDPEQTAYYSILEEKRRFQKEINKYSEGSFRSAKGDALYNFKLALRLGDREAAIKYLTLYIQRGGTDKGLQQSLKAMHPLHGLNKEDQATFVSRLDKDQLQELKEAIHFYETTLLGK